MKKMNVFILLFSLLISYQFSNAQDCKYYFTLDEGTELTVKHYDKKGKVSGTSVRKLVKKEMKGDAVEAEFSIHYEDKKGKNPIDSDLGMRCENGKFYIDMSQYLDQNSLSAYKDMEMEMESDELLVPSNISQGQKLEDGKITMTVKNQGMNIMTMAVNITNRLVEATEQLKTPAGTFDCAVITYDIQSKIGFMNVSTKGKEWYAEEIGVVKSESYDKRGKLVGYTVLEKIDNP